MKIILIADDDVFATVMLQKLHHNIAKNINLYKPVNNKLYFHELEVSDHRLHS